MSGTSAPITAVRCSEQSQIQHRRLDDHIAILKRLNNFAATKFRTGGVA